MPIGKEVGAFTSTATSMTQAVDGAGKRTFTMNFEGSVSGGWEGAGLSTIHATAANDDLSAGTFTGNFAVYLEGGGVAAGSGSGVFGSCGEHKWQLNGVGLLTDGTRLAFESTLALDGRSLNGKMYEIG